MQVLAPIDGKIERIEPHVFSVGQELGAVMVQLGIKTEELSGEEYTVHKAVGDDVRKGDAIVSWDPAQIEARGLVPLVLVVAIGSDQNSLTDLKRSGRVEVGDLVFTSS